MSALYPPVVMCARLHAECASTPPSDARSDFPPGAYAPVPPVKHADETKWPCDGKSGYAWGFFSPTVSIYRFRGTRGSEVPVDMFGPGPHLGVLVVDRYAGYNSSWLGPMQYCFEHDKRNVGDLLEANPKNAESQKHIPSFLGLLREAMKLRSSCDGEKYNVESRRIRDEILSLVESPVKDGKLKGYFDLMKEKRHRFFQWVEHPEVEAENNLFASHRRCRRQADRCAERTRQRSGTQHLGLAVGQDRQALTPLSPAKCSPNAG